MGIGKPLLTPEQLGNLDQYILTREQVDALQYKKLNPNTWYCYVLKEDKDALTKTNCLIIGFLGTDQEGVLAEEPNQNQHHIFRNSKQEEWQNVQSKKSLGEFLEKEAAPQFVEGNYKFLLLTPTDYSTLQVQDENVKKLQGIVKNFPKIYNQKQDGFFKKFKKHRQDIANLVTEVSKSNTLQQCVEKLEQYYLDAYTRWCKNNKNDANPKAFFDYINREYTDHHATRLVMILLRDIYTTYTTENFLSKTKFSEECAVTYLRDKGNLIFTTNRIGFVSDVSDDHLMKTKGIFNAEKENKPPLIKNMPR
ncbi:MAG: hypothetical protein A3F42_05975 [Gammaproteobacteria bacterium RIFCSPHIGHO2_12_FULL_37_34]|nr:MAG: hypothetical protein A3F42_05975 [Gammaproteobacteria bacterium RIFCSPHIGHO2_12_FULL_37_34]